MPRLLPPPLDDCSAVVEVSVVSDDATEWESVPTAVFVLAEEEV